MDKEYSKIIVNRILSLCKSRRITINTLANMSGVSQSTLDNLINGGHLIQEQRHCTKLRWLLV